MLVNPRIAVLAVVVAAMMPPPPADFNAWAESNIVFGRESPLPGPYSRASFPLAERVLEWLGPEHPARVVTVVGDIQSGKTTLAQIFIGASMDIDPCDMGYVHPTHDNAVRWSRRKWTVMRRESPALQRLFGEAKSRDATNTALYQETRDGRGSLQISGANSEASLSMVSWPKQVQDDLSKWEANAGGDPERQADGRSAAFSWAKILKISPPRHARTCRITRAFNAGTQERWHVPCPHCEHYQPLEWQNFQASIERDHPERAHFTCVACGCAIEHKHKLDIIARGRSIADNPSAREPSIRWWRAYSRFRDWESIAREWLAAEGDPKAEMVFWNEVLALAYESASEAPPWEGLRDRANAEDGYDRGRLPIGALLLCVGADVQGDRVEVHIKGYGAQLRRWTVDYEIIPHFIGTEEAQHALDALLGRVWPDTYGNPRPIDMLAIDGNAYTNEVFAWAKRHSWHKVIVVRGAKTDLAPPLALTKTERRPDGKVKRVQKRFYNVGVSGLKSAFYEMLKRVDPLARGYCGYPRGLTDEFFRQLTAERREVVVDKKTGFPRAYWRLDHDRNEVLDTEMYAEAAAVRCGWYTKTAEQWDALRSEREQPRETGQTDLFDPATAVQVTAVEPAPAPQVSNAAHQAAPHVPKSFLGGNYNNYWRK